jgi:hypothetical protein
VKPPASRASRPFPWKPSNLWVVLVPSLALFLIPAAGQQPASAPTKVLKVKGGTIHITLPGEPMKASSHDLLHWIQNAADAVSNYYGRFPVPHLTLLVRSSNGSGVRHGMTYGTDGGLIRVSVGRETPVDELNDDWVLTHEMTHLAFPSMPDDQHWIEEGLATYIEPVARAQVGQMPVAEMWREFIRDMPKGEPQEGDRGLDHTPTWGRTYWGGAIFVLVADVSIRERTKNRLGLQDALRAIMNQGTIADDWEIKKALAVGDKATGTNVLQDLYQKMANQPAPVDLAQMWDKLGLALRDGKVVFNDKAADAAIRIAITAPRH